MAFDRFDLAGIARRVKVLYLKHIPRGVMLALGVIWTACITLAVVAYLGFVMIEDALERTP